MSCISLHNSQVTPFAEERESWTYLHIAVVCDVMFFPTEQKNKYINKNDHLYHQQTKLTHAYSTKHFAPLLHVLYLLYWLHIHINILLDHQLSQKFKMLGNVSNNVCQAIQYPHSNPILYVEIQTSIFE